MAIGKGLTQLAKALNLKRVMYVNQDKANKIGGK